MPHTTIESQNSGCRRLRVGMSASSGDGNSDFRSRLSTSVSTPPSPHQRSHPSLLLSPRPHTISDIESRTKPHQRQGPKKKVLAPEIESGAAAWKAAMLPLHHASSHIVNLIRTLYYLTCTHVSRRRGAISRRLLRPLRRRRSSMCSLAGHAGPAGAWDGKGTSVVGRLGGCSRGPLAELNQN